jgi:hypothetical protein
MTQRCSLKFLIPPFMQNLTHPHSHTPAEVSFSTNVGWVPKDVAPILDKRNQSAYNEPAYHMQGIEHIVPSSMVDLFCNNNMLTIAKNVFHKKATLVLIHNYHQWAWLKMSKHFQSRHYPPIISLDIRRGITPSHLLHNL